MRIKMRALGIIILAAPRITGARAQPVFITLLISAEPITVVVVIRSFVYARWIIVPAAFAFVTVPIIKVSVSASIKTATMIVMTSPSFAIAIVAISIRAAIAGRTGRERAAVARPIADPIFRADGDIGAATRAVISVTILVLVPAPSASAAAATASTRRAAAT